ncbi:MAG TPA: TonB-dependent receptor [Steroidobacteraceae bacterium]|nr:TonB-dependent receptor [Steroidobacteraceae bacterium]
MNRKRLYGTVFGAAAMAGAAFTPSPVLAQSADAVLRGKAAPNAVVTAKNVATGASRRTTAGADGNYTLSGLPAGTYTVDAGAGTEQTVTLSVASSVSLDLAAGTGEADTGTLEEVIVKATRLVETKTSEVGTQVSQQQIETTPQITRNFLEFADTVPGMVFNVDSKGNTSVQSGAQANSSINVYLDGVGQKNYVKSGGIAGQAGSGDNGDPGNPFPQLAIGEYKVITSNYKAEYGQISSAAITAATKSGTNEFHGEIFGDYTNQSMRAATPAEAAAGDKATSASKEYGMAIGGPIIQDRLHFFATWEHKGFSLPNSVQPPAALSGVDLQAVLPPDVYAQYGPTTNPFTENLYFGKLDFEPSDVDRFELSGSYRRETQISGASDQTAASAAYAFQNDVTRGTLKWQRSSDNWLNEALATYEKTVDLPTPLSDNPAITYTYIIPPNGAVDAITINGQDPRQYTDKHQDGWGLQDDFTLNNLNWLGDHTLKTGVSYKAVQLVARDGSSAAKFWYGVDPVTGVEDNPYKVVFGKVNSGLPLSATSDNKQFAVYFQDDWAMNNKLTMNLGIRYDYEQTPSYENYVTLPAIVAALNSLYPANTVDPVPQPTAGETYRQALALGGINIDNYISNGHNRKPFAGELQPRLGFSFDLNEDQKHVIFGGAGRSYDRNLFDRLQLENSKNALSEPEIDFYGGNSYVVNGCSAASASNTCVAWNPAYLTDPSGLQALGSGVGEVDMFPNNLKVPYSDQYSLGMRNKLGDWNTSATLTHIESFNGLLGVLGNRYANGEFADAGCGASWGGAPAQWCSSGVPGIGSLILWENGQATRSNELLVYAEKPNNAESPWGMTIAYTYSNAKQNRLYTDGYAFDLPHVRDYPFTLSNAVAKHRLVLTGSYDAPWGFVFAGKLTLETPIPITYIRGCGTSPVSCNKFGTNGYPVAATFDQTLGYKTLDLQATKNFALGGGFSMYARLDVLNVANWHNYDPTSASQSADPQYNTTGPIVGVPRTLKVTVGAKF